MLTTSARIRCAASVKRRRHLWLYLLLYLLLVWICCYCYFPGFFECSLRALLPRHLYKYVHVCVISVLAVSLYPYLLFVCLPWLLPFALCFFSRPHFLFNQKPANGQTLKAERHALRARKRRVDSWNQIVTWSFIYSLFASKITLLFSNYVQRCRALSLFSGRHARLDTDAYTKIRIQRYRFHELLFRGREAEGWRLLIYLLAQKKKGQTLRLLRAQASSTKMQSNNYT